MMNVVISIILFFGGSVLIFWGITEYKKDKKRKSYLAENYLIELVALGIFLLAFGFLVLLGIISWHYVIPDFVEELLN